VNCFVVARLPSLARTVKKAETVWVGIPVIAPLASSVRPDGSDPPVTDQLEAVPPEVESWKPYRAPT
jgi:hypothetical protein